MNTMVLLLLASQLPPTEIGNLPASNFIQWLLTAVLIGGGGLGAWAIRTVVNRFTLAMDKFEGTMVHLNTVLTKVEAVEGERHAHLVSRVESVAVAVQSAVRESGLKVEAVTREQTDRLTLEIERATGRVIDHVSSLAEKGRHNTRDIFMVLVSELVRQKVLDDNAAQRVMAMADKETPAHKGK